MKFPFKILFSLAFVSVLFHKGLVAQPLTIRNDIPVTHNGDTLDFAWAGGMNCPQFSTIDLDLDGLEDLLIFDRFDNMPITFLQRGSGANKYYEYAPEFENLIPDSLYGWVLARDFNGDGDKDIFAGTQGSNLQIYKNTSSVTGNLSFELFDPQVYSHYPSFNALYTALSDIPGIADLDGDGDLDFINFDVLAYQIEWHKNVSVDSGWGMDSVEFYLQSYCYGHFFEDPSNCTALVNQPPCAAGMRVAYDYDPATFMPPMHAGSTLLPIELNGDTVIDLVIGDAPCNTFYALYNDGSTSIANFGSVEADYPTSDTAVNVYTFPGGYYEDIDFDGVKDLIAAPNQQGGGEDKRCVWMYKNDGQNNLPDFHFQQTDFIQGEMIETGTGTYPAFVDYDGDGLMDIILGNRSHKPPTLTPHIPSLQLLHNTGTAIQPAFEIVDTNFLGLLTHPNFDLVKDITPAPGDLDGDGDFDLLLGCTAGRLFYFRNDGNATTPNYVLVDTFYQSIKPDNMSSPVLYDLDNDNDLDLLCGTSKGYIAYYENTGTNLIANFDSITGKFGKIKINNFTGQVWSSGNSRPCIADIDTNGIPDLLVGGVEGYVDIFYNITLGPNDSFPNGGKLLDHDFGIIAAPSAAILDTTGRLTYVIGDYGGGLHLAGFDPIPTSVDPAKEVAFDFIVYPNPASDHIETIIKGISPGITVTYKTYNSLGQIIHEAKSKGSVYALNTGTWSRGIYLLEAEWGGKRVSKKIILD